MKREEIIERISKALDELNNSESGYACAETLDLLRTDLKEDGR